MISRNNPDHRDLVRQIDDTIKRVRATDHYPVGWFERMCDWVDRQVWWLQMLSCFGLGTVLALLICAVILFVGERI